MIPTSRTETFDDLEHVRRQKDRRSARDKRREQIADHTRRDRIDPLEWLVEKQQVGIRQDAAAMASFFFMPWEYSTVSFFSSPAKPSTARSSSSGCGSCRAASDEFVPRM